MTRNRRFQEAVDRANRIKEHLDRHHSTTYAHVHLETRGAACLSQLCALVDEIHIWALRTATPEALTT